MKKFLHSYQFAAPLLLPLSYALWLRTVAESHRFVLFALAIPGIGTNRLGLGYDQDFLGAITAGRWKLSPAAQERFDVGRYCNLDPQGE